MMGILGNCMTGMGIVGPGGLVLLGGLAAGLVYLAREPRRTGTPVAVAYGADEDRALTLLRERYARGEIDHAEYEQRRATLARETEWAR